MYKFASTLTDEAHRWKRDALKEKGFFIEYKLDDGEKGHWNTRVRNARTALKGEEFIPAVYLVGKVSHRYRLWKITDTALFLVPERERNFLIEMNKAKGNPPLEDTHTVYEIYHDERWAQVFANATPISFASFTCPKCQLFGIIDAMQYNGMVSIKCPGGECDFHGTIDFRRPANG